MKIRPATEYYFIHAFWERAPPLPPPSTMYCKVDRSNAAADKIFVVELCGFNGVLSNDR